MTARILVTTADERTWRNDVPILFLGEWCRRLDREAVWSGLDHLVARPVLADATARARALDRIQTVVLQLQVELADRLNSIHSTRHSRRFWRILTGQWVHRYVNVIYHRWHAVAQATQEWDISGTAILDTPRFDLSVPDSDSFIWATNDARWNNLLFGAAWTLITGRPADSLHVEQRAVEQGRAFAQQQRQLPAFDSWLDRAASLLQRDTDALIIGSYLPPLAASALCLRLGQIPRRRKSPVMQAAPADPALRDRFRLESDAEGFDGFVRAMLIELLPTCFLEGFELLSRQATEVDWPRNPRFIFTSVNFDTDDIFKRWAAGRAEKGIPYITGQHGNNYGTLRYIPSEWECVATSDAFITWGWRDRDPRCLPAFIFRTVGRNARGHSAAGGLLLVELCLPSLVWAWDPYPEFQGYQEDQFAFVAALPDAIRSATTVRLHAENRKQPWFEPVRWQRRQPDVLVDDGTDAVAGLIARSRLIVHSYDSTGILETLARNIPTICFWSGGLSHLRASAVPDYQLLMDAGILFETPQAAARQVAVVWEAVESWWDSTRVQAARVAFCNRYARTSPRPIAELAAILKSVSANQ